MFMQSYLSLSLSLYIYTSIHQYIYIYIYIYIYLYKYIYLSIYRSIYTYLYLYLYLSISINIQTHTHYLRPVSECGAAHDHVQIELQRAPLQRLHQSSRQSPHLYCAERGEHRPIEWGRGVRGGLSSTLGVARCGRSAGCVLCVLWAVSAAVCVGGWGGTLWG